MILIAEIYLTIQAWRKGWGGLALLPGALCLVAGFFLGAALGEEASEGSLIAVGLVCDGAAIAALIAMCVHAPKAAGEKERALESGTETASAEPATAV